MELAQFKTVYFLIFFFMVFKCVISCNSQKKKRKKSLKKKLQLGQSGQKVSLPLWKFSKLNKKKRLQLFMSNRQTKNFDSTNENLKLSSILRRKESPEELSIIPLIEFKKKIPSKGKNKTCRPTSWTAARKRKLKRRVNNLKGSVKEV